MLRAGRTQSVCVRPALRIFTIKIRIFETMAGISMLNRTKDFQNNSYKNGHFYQAIVIFSALGRS